MIFLAACGVFSVSILYLNISRQHKHQYHVLAGGGVVGCFLGMQCHKWYKPLALNIIRYLPVSLLVSQAANNVVWLLQGQSCATGSGFRAEVRRMEEVKITS
jgi:hypothetical protein